MQLDLPAAWLLNYGLLVARILTLVVFAPFPGGQRTPQLSKIGLGLMLAAALTPLAQAGPGVDIVNSPAAPWMLLKYAAAETAFGAAIGVAFRLVIEAFGLAAQVMGFQAGFSYVNTVDPTSEVDASILNVAAVLLANLLFFAFDLHLFIVSAVARSLERWPLGSFAFRPGSEFALIELSAQTLEIAVRLALPAMAVMLLIDLTLGLLNQAQSRLQLLQMAFPIKIVAGVAVLFFSLRHAPQLFERMAESAAEYTLSLSAF